MRIVFFSETYVPNVSGLVTRLRNTIRVLVQRGHTVLMVAPDGGVSSDEGARIVGLPGIPLPLYPEILLALPRASLRRTLLEFRPDVIHVAEPALLGLAGIYYSEVMRVPLVMSYHTHLPKYLRYYHLGWVEPVAWRLLRLRHRRAFLTLCTSASAAAELNAHGIGPSTIWRRAVDTDRFHPSRASFEMRRRLTQGHPDAPLLLYVGRLAAEKNVGRLKAVVQGIPGARLAVVGDGPQRPALERQFAGVPAFFTGYLHGDDLASAYASSDVFLLPSGTETLGLVLLEAMASGCPAITIRAGGPTEVIHDGVDGFLYDPDREDDLLTLTRRLVSDTPLRIACAAAARREAERWSWTAATAQVEECYASACSSAMTSPTNEDARSTSSLSRLARRQTLAVLRALFP